MGSSSEARVFEVVMTEGSERRLSPIATMRISNRELLLRSVMVAEVLPAGWTGS